MLRRAIVYLVPLFLAGCASEPRDVIATAELRSPPPEMACMSDCLQEGAETGESCLERCVDAIEDGVASSTN